MQTSRFCKEKRTKNETFKILAYELANRREIEIR